MRSSEGKFSGSCEGGISLWRIDRFLRGELPESEAALVRDEIEKSSELKEYVRKQGEERSSLTLDRILSGLSSKAVPAVGGPFRALATFFSLLFRFPVPVAAFAMLMIGAGLWSIRMEPAPASLHQAKGSEKPQVRMLIRGQELRPSESVDAGPGDTLSLSYLSPFPVHAQIWYQEDDRETMPMSHDLEWPATTSWRKSPHQVVLEGEWSRQAVWVVVSRSPLGKPQIEAALGGNPPPGAQAEVFRIVRPR